MAQTVQELRAELDQALVDLEQAETLSEFNQTLVDILEELRKRGEPKDAPAPEVSVNVQPAPVTVTVQPAPTHDFEITHEHDGDGRIVKSHVRRVKGKDQ